MKRDLSVSLNEAAAQSLRIILPLMAVQAAAFILLRGLSLPQSPNYLLYGFLLLSGIFVHEALHVLAWMIFGGKSLAAFRVGFDWKALAPYAHCKEPMNISAYRLGGLAPGLLLGILPWAASLFAGDILLFLYGWLYTAAAGGDFLILWILRGIKAGAQVEDHPSRAGCYIIEE